ncbi:type VII secretion integral membrane protein EccD [Fodinicola acaciae]|uniref:type VII secretion integral membrane protein EccD n=1 Tax=Fodinicola acaciae TaxID=2681555 RepID=UPI0013D795E0|nr:type VII secretion integral membrane protein EccD [Fodinicola acaciae]
MPTAYSRVTIVHGARRVDLALPTELPVADVVPQVLRFCLPESGGDRPESWSLGRVGGKPIVLSRSLTEEGVVDGDVLELVSAGAGNPEAYVEDVRDAVEDAVDSSDDLWVNRTTQGFALMAGAIGMAGLLLLPAARASQQPGPLIAAAIAAILLCAAAWWAGRNAYVRAATVLVTVAAGWGALAGWLLAAWLGASAYGSLGAALAYLVAVVVISRGLTPYATPHLAACAVIVPAGAAGAIFGLLDLSVDNVARIEILLAIVLTGMLPRASIAVGGLAAADFRLRTVARITERELADRVRQSTYLLTGSLAGAAIVVAAAAGWLIRSTAPWDLVLLPAAGVLLILRSRAFGRVRHVLPLRLGGVVVLAGCGIAALLRVPALLPWTAALAMVAVVAVVAVAALPTTAVTTARIKQILNWVEILMVVVVLVVAVGATGVFAAMASFEGLK